MSSEAQGSATHQLLVFELEGARFGVEAGDVDAVIAWREPVSLPGASGPVRGVVQDRGRIVSVLHHPASATVTYQDDPRRIIICRTRSGLLGLPASSMRAVSNVEVLGELVPGEPVETDAGNLIFVAPDAIAESIVATRRRREVAESMEPA